VSEVAIFLAERARAALGAGIGAVNVWLDPGIGFGKRLAHNLALLARLERIVALGFPVLVGASRKGFLGALDPAAPSAGEGSVDRLTARPGGDLAADRLAASLAAAALAAARGARIIRVHDVAATRRALAVADAVARAGRVGG